MSIVDELVREAPIDLAAAKRRYAALLDSAEPADKPSLAALMKQIGKTPEQARTDAQTRRATFEKEAGHLTSAQLREIERQRDEGMEALAGEIRALVHKRVDEITDPDDFHWGRVAVVLNPLRNPIDELLTKRHHLRLNADNKISADRQSRQETAQTRREFPDAFADGR